MEEHQTGLITRGIQGKKKKIGMKQDL